jgi:hypothetical protein
MKIALLCALIMFVFIAAGEVLVSLGVPQLGLIMWTLAMVPIVVSFNRLRQRNRLW